MSVVAQLKNIVGNRHVKTSPRATKRFRKGFRSGEGEVEVVVIPGSLLELWQVLQIAVAADRIIIMQAANTGLTEGSTPKGQYDRKVILVSTRRMNQLQFIQNGDQVISFPGASLFDLEKQLGEMGRQPHSVIGSSCIGASIVGGVCNSSGGSLVERGPAYTELSLYAQIDENGQLSLVNELGVELGDSPEDILTRLQQGKFDETDVIADHRSASASDYVKIVRDVDADTPARFNADKSRLYGASGCAGKLAVFAVRVDTFPSYAREKTFYVGTKDEDVFTDLRRAILSEFKTLPVSAEYMHAEAYDIAADYGKDTMVMIDKLGTARLPQFFALKGTVDAWLENIPFLSKFTDQFLQFAMRFWPEILPKRSREFRQKYPHHLILKMHDGGIEEAQTLLESLKAQGKLNFFECNPREAKMVGLHRFAAAGAAIRYLNVHPKEAGDIIALDIALRRNDKDWFEKLPADISEQIVAKLYYGHFMCHVLHQDYIVKKGADPAKIKAAMLDILDQRGSEYPAEHNVGHLYKAKPDLANFYKELDPTNSMNPGIGKMSRNKHYAEH